MTLSMQAPAGRALSNVIRDGAATYDRRRVLPGLIRATETELADESPAARAAIVDRLERALRAERNRARSGHWTYDLNRHIALKQAFEAERSAQAGSAAS